MKHPSSLNRRQFLEITATAVAAAPFVLTHAAESSLSGPARFSSDASVGTSITWARQPTPRRRLRL